MTIGDDLDLNSHSFESDRELAAKLKGAFSAVMNIVTDP